jgi:DNA repair protein RadD
MEIVLKMRPNFRAIILVKDVKLIKQTIDKFTDKSLVSITCASLGQKELGSTPFLVGTVQTLQSKNISGFSLIVVDECDRQTSAHRKILEMLPGANVLSVTATPFTNKGFIFGKDKTWEDITFRLEEKDAEKFLCPVILQGTKYNIDTKGLGHSGYDYNMTEATEKYTDELLDKQLSDLRERSRDRNKIAIICCSIEHSERIMEKLDRCSLIHSKQTTGEQGKQLYDFTHGKNRYLVSVNMISVGFDFPPLDCIAIFRPMRSYSLYSQVVGRGRRKHPSKKNILLLDYGKVVENLGLPEDIWNNITERKPSAKLCPLCSTFLPTSTKECTCGFSFILPPQVQRKTGDYQKNLTESAYSEGKKVTAITTAWHVSAKGNRCLKVMFWQGVKLLHAEYLMPYQRDKINKLLERIIYPRSPYTDLENVREQIIKATHIVKSIVLKKDGKFKTLHQTRW